MSDYEKIRKKYNHIKKGMRCLTSKELGDLKKLEVFTSPYAQDLVAMVKD